MKIEPYKRTPAEQRMAWLDRAGQPVSEEGELLAWDDWPAGTRLFTSWDTAYALVRAGEGEALCWNGEEIRWRHAAPQGGDGPYGWRPSSNDAHVIRYPFDDADVPGILRALAGWRTWLEREGAGVVGSTGSCAWSLLRATLEAPLWTRVGERPPLAFVAGGRIENGPAGSGAFAGLLHHHDLPAAYASTLGGLRYGGRWFEVTGEHEPEWYASNGLPVFARARVRLPAGVPFGLLLRRPRHRGYLAGLLEGGYPNEPGRRIQGVWTWPELELARRYGASVQLLRVWAHRARLDQTPFLPWWRAVERGRGMEGLAGQLAKMTGNALWGRLAMDAGQRGERFIRSRTGGSGRLVQRRLPSRPAPPPDHALAETVSGRIRAQLTEAMLVAGPDLVCAHTDGLWCEAAHPFELELEGWRQDKAARRLELVQPMILRWWPMRGSSPRVVFAGVPAGVAERAFEEVWTRRNPGEER